MIPAGLDFAHYEWVKTRLTAIPNLTVYDGAVSPTPPLGSDGKVKAYAVLFWPAPALTAPHMCGTTTDLADVFQVTVAGGDQQRVVNAVGWVDTALIDTRPVIAGRSCNRVRCGPDAGPMRRDDDVSPPRFFVPRAYRISSVPA